jgi:hypothetical protein
VRYFKIGLKSPEIAPEIASKSLKISTFLLPYPPPLPPLSPLFCTFRSLIPLPPLLFSLFFALLTSFVVNFFGVHAGIYLGADLLHSSRM